MHLLRAVPCSVLMAPLPTQNTISSRHKTCFCKYTATAKKNFQKKTHHTELF